MSSRLTAGCAVDAEDEDGPRPTERKTLQFSLDHLPASLVCTLEVGDRRYALTRHDATSLESQREDNALLRAIPDAELTHFASAVELPADAPQSYLVTYAIPGTEMRSLALAGLHVPKVAVKQAQALKGASFGFLEFRRKQLGIETVAPVLAGGLHTLACRASGGGAEGEITDLAEFVDEYDAARYLVFHHPDVLSLDGGVAATLLHHLDCSDGLDVLAKAIGDAGATQQPDGDPGLTAWARGVYTRDPDGNRVPQEDESGKALVDAAGRPLYQWHYALDEDVQAALGSVIADALKRIADDADLDRVRFHVAEARSTDAEPLPDAPRGLLQAPGDAGGGGYEWKALTEAWDGGQCVSALTIEDSAARKVSFDVANSYQRHLGVFCAFLDPSGKPFKLSEIAADHGVKVGPLDLDTPYLQYQGMLAPPPWLLGIPLPAPVDVARERFTTRIPPGAAKLAVLTTAIGSSSGAFRSEYAGISTAAVALTVVSEFGIPVVALAYGLRPSRSRWTTFLKELVIPSIQLGGKIVSLGTKVTQGAGWANIGIWAANTVLKLVFAAGGTALAIWAEALALGAVTRGIPIFGMGLWAIQAADTAHQITRTAVGITKSSTVLKTEISSTLRVRVRVKPADKFGFPQTGTTWKVTLKPDGGETSPQEGVFDALVTPTGFEVVFPTIAAGGRCTFTVKILSRNGFVAGYVTGSFLNVLTNGATEIAVDAAVQNQPIPITKDTVYSTKAKLAVVDGTKHAWVATTEAPPGGTSRACEGASESICAPTAIAIDGTLAQLGYSWQAAEQALKICGGTTGGTALHTITNLNLDVFQQEGAPDATLKDPECGLIKPIFPLYPIQGGRSLVLEPSTGAYILREIDLTALATSDFRTGAVIARLSSTTVRAAAILRGDTVMVISGEGGVDALEVVNLRNERPATLTTAPLAAPRSGSGSLRGNIRDAVAVCPVYDADVFLVLENGNHRIQAFGVNGNPCVDYFTKGTIKSAFLDLPAGREYLDISVELRSGTIYVLSRTGTTALASDFRLDIYERKSSLLLTTTFGFAAAKIALDNNQNVYALGWNVLTFRARRQPGVWRWIPSTPPGDG